MRRQRDINADLRDRLAEQDERIACLEQLVALLLTDAKSEQRNEENLPAQPPGVWISRKEARYRVRRCESWIRKWIDLGMIQEREEGGRKLVELSSVQRANVRSPRMPEDVPMLAHDYRSETSTASRKRRPA